MPVLSVHVLGDGERVPMLHDDVGLPLFYPNLFATSQLRNAGAAVNTIRNQLSDLVVLMRWEQKHRRDLIEEFRSGRFLTVADVDSLRDFAKLDMRHWQSDGKASAGDVGEVVDFIEAKVAMKRALPAIGCQQHFNRLSTIADYLEFVASVVTQHQNSAKNSQEIARMAKTIRKHRPKGLAAQIDEDLERSSPPTDVVERFMAVATEGDPRNPFRDPGIQLRNAILFGLARLTGMRRGELLSLRIDQFELGHEPQVWVRRNQDDPHDSRAYQPVAKTKERPLAIPESLANKIDRYIFRVRAKIAPARRHPYLFVSHHKGPHFGSPLSISALNQMFERMREVDATFDVIHAHAFRHHFNYELSVSIDEKNDAAKLAQGDGSLPLISEARELDIRAFANGHRSRASGQRYNRRRVREATDRAVRQVQSTLERSAKKTDESNGSN
jgi:integrase